MNRLSDVVGPVPSMLIGTQLPFTDGEVVIESVETMACDERVDVVVRYRVGNKPSEHFTFTVDDDWGFGSAQDVVDQLRIDLLEELDTREPPVR